MVGEEPDASKIQKKKKKKKKKAVEVDTDEFIRQAAEVEEQERKLQEIEAK